MSVIVPNTTGCHKEHYVVSTKCLFKSLYLILTISSLDEAISLVSMMVSKQDKVGHALKILKRSGLLKKESFKVYVMKKRTLKELKMKYLEWEDRSEGIVWPVKKKLRYVQSFELPREM